MSENQTHDESAPSEIFSRRLRETRRARGVTQAQLAQWMTDRGRPLSRRALVEIENGARGISLDEALALAACLSAVPANLLSPAEDEWLMLTDTLGVDGGGLRNWLITGDPINAWPSTPREEDRAALDAILEESLSAYAQALVDSIRAKDADGRTAAYRAMTTAIDRHKTALAAIPSEGETDHHPRRKRPSNG